jgi:hypothetical protein
MKRRNLGLIKLCKDFTFNNKKLSDFGYISVEFDDTNEATFGLERELIKGEPTRYRVATNHLGADYREALTFEIHIVKEESECSNDIDEMEISRDDVRNISKWLTETEHPTWLKFTNTDGKVDDLRYCGVFTDIKGFKTNRLYGLKLTFTNNSPFAYTNNIVSTHTVNNNVTAVINNDSDLTNRYSYPNIRMVTTRAGQQEVYICNLSDTNILEEGAITLGSTNFDTMIRLNGIIEKYAETWGYAVVYERDNNNNYITRCNNTAVQIRLDAHDGNEKKCMAFFNVQSRRYYIVQGGFIFLTLRQHLQVNINSRQMRIYDGIDRMILMSDIGVSDVGYVYFPRLKSGSNTLLFYGLDCTFTIDRIEERKVGILE